VSERERHAKRRASLFARARRHADVRDLVTETVVIVDGSDILTGQWRCSF